MVAQEHFYVVTPFSLYLVRSDKNWVTEIHTSTACQAIVDNFSKDPQKQLLLPPGSFERTKIDNSNANLKFDGSRLVPLNDNKLLVATANGEFRLIQIKFD